MFHALFSRFPQGKASSVFTDLKEMNEEQVYLFTMIPDRSWLKTFKNHFHEILKKVSGPTKQFASHTIQVIKCSKKLTGSIVLIVSREK